MPAPVSSSRSACSRTTMRKPLRASASAAVSPPIPAPATMTIREDATTPAPGRRLNERVGQGAFRRPCGLGSKLWVVTVERRAIGANVFSVIAHVAIDMRMIERRQRADAHEFPGADLDDRDA